MFESQQTTGYVVLCALGLLLFIHRFWIRSPGNLKLPPGPPGNRLSVGPNIVRQFNEWANEYGPIFSFKNGRQRIVVLTTYQAAVDVMQKHGSDLADRPRTVAAGEILSGDMRTLLVGAGERLKKLRRALHSQLQASAARQYAPLQRRNAKDYVRNMLADPEHHLDHGRTYAASVIMELTYSKTTPTTYSDPEVKEVVKCLGNFFEALRIGRYLVDALPFLKYIPFGGVAELKKRHEDELSLFESQLFATKDRMAKNATQPCFATYLFEHQKEYELSDAELAYLAGSMFGAGSDTTASGLGIITMAAATHPHELKKVQAQLDEVVGRDRMPNFDDEPVLTQVTAFVLEVHRWRLIAPFGFAHKATKDIPWRDYIIPSGSIVYGNHWTIMHDPDVFAEPETFNPDRWLDEKGRIRDDLKHFDFGFGRRVCPGQYVAERSLFINTALMFWAFNIREDPAAPIDTMSFTDGSVVHPQPFRVSIEARNPNLREILEADVD